MTHLPKQQGNQRVPVARADLHVHRPLPQTSMPIGALVQVARPHNTGRQARKVPDEHRALLRLFYPLRATPVRHHSRLSAQP